MPIADYKLTIDESDVENVLKSLEGRFFQFEKSGDKAMKGLGRSVTKMGGVMRGAVGGAIALLGQAVLQFGTQAVAVFAGVIQASTEMAGAFDVTKRKFVSIFDGAEDQADAVMDHIGQRAAQLGIDLNDALGAGAAFIPDLAEAEDPIKQLDNLLGAFRGLAIETPEQGIAGARFAIEEAMSGNLKSLRARFNFIPVELRMVKEAQKELGETIGLIEGINKVLERRGVNVEAGAESLAGAASMVQFAVSKLQIEMGRPIADAMTKSLSELGETLAGKSDDLQLLAGSIGDVVANVIDFLATNVNEFLKDFDVAGLQEMVISFGKMVNQVLVLGDILLDLELGEGIFDDITWLFGKLEQALETLNQIVALVKGAQSAVSSFTDAISLFSKEQTERTTLFGNFEVALPKINKDFLDFGKGAKAGQDAFKESMLDSLDAMDKGNQRLQKNAEALDARKDALGRDTAAALENAAATIKGKAASEGAQSALEKLGLTEKQITKIHKDAASTLQDRNNIEKRFSQERADNHRKSMEEIEDIEQQHKLNIQQAETDLSISSRNIALKHGQERSDAETDLRRQLINIEQDYQNELDRIARQTKLSLESAEVSQDALAFVEALKQQEVAEEEAALTRDEAETGARTTNEQRLADLEESQARERETLQISYQDKLAALQTQLAQEFAEQELADLRKAEQQSISEQRRLEGLAQGQADRLAGLTEGLNAEQLAIVQAEAAKLASIESFSKKAQDSLDEIAKKADEVNARIAGSSGQGRGSRGESSNPTSPTDRQAAIEENRRAQQGLPRRLGGRVTAGISYRVGEVGLEGYLPRRQLGGQALAGQPTLVGELGEELFIPPTSGTIIPSSQIGAFMGQDRVGGGNTTQINYQPNFELSNPAVLSPEQQAHTRSIAVSIASQMFQQVMKGTR